MSNTKKVTISLTPEQQKKARSLSKDLFGKENISMIHKQKKQHYENTYFINHFFNSSRYLVGI